MQAASSSVLAGLADAPRVDRLRYQAKHVFDHMDTDADGVSGQCPLLLPSLACALPQRCPLHAGKLSPEQVAAYVQYSEDRLGKGNALLDAL
jgi:hypothetical protein